MFLTQLISAIHCDKRLLPLLPLLPAFVLPGLLTVLSAAEDIDQTLLDLPAPVKAAIQREGTGQSIGGIERGTRDGLAMYYVRIEMLEGFAKHLTIASDGVVMKIIEYPAVNEAIATSTGAKVATKEPAAARWEATVATVRKTVEAYRSDELTLNQVPALPRAALEGIAAGDRVQNIHASGTGTGTVYRADITQPDGAKRTIAVQDDGTFTSVP